MLRKFRQVLDVFLASLLLFALLNLAVAGWFILNPPTPLAFKRLSVSPDEYREHLYPGYSKDEVEELITESWSIPFVYEEITQFREATTSGKYVNVSEHGFREVANQGPWPPDESYINI